MRPSSWLFAPRGGSQRADHSSPPSSRRSARACVLFTALLASSVSAGCAAVLGAQHTPPTLRASTDPVVQRADSLAALGDTTKALAVLAAAVTTHSTTAAVWHRYGVMLWQQVAARRRGSFMADQKAIRTLRLADSALRLATEFARDSAAYWVSLAQFNLQSDVATMRFAATQQMETAQKAAARVGDSTWLALAADEVGLAAWRRRETTANRAMVGAGQHMQLQTNSRFPRGKARDFLASFANKIAPPTGRADFESALRQFRLASAVAPSSLRYSRHLYMALATGNRWDELLAIATARARLSTFDAQARMAQGVALHRLGRTAAARAAFDSALLVLDESVRAELFRLDRLLPPGVSLLTGQRGMDVTAFRELSAAQREAMRAVYWALNDPNPATAENEAELEFLSRATQADWTWTDEALGLRGADTDRGDIFIRYGPPDDEMTLSGSSSVVEDLSPSAELPEDYWTGGGKGPPGGMRSTSQTGGATLAWLYRSGDVFFFDLAAGFGTARIPISDRQFVEDVASMKPSTFDNVAGPIRVGAIQLRVTRFRGPSDSADVVLAADLPSRVALRDSGSSAALSETATNLRREDVLVSLRLVDGAARVVGLDSTRSALAASSVTPRTWVQRLGTGAAFARLDALDESTNRTASALVPVAVERYADFGVSDVLLTSVNANAREAVAASVTRWRDLGVTPSAGVYRSGERIGLVWETYALASAANANHYRVAVTVTRNKRRGADALVLRVLDRLGGLISQGSTRDDELTVSFDRKVAARPTQVDYLVLDGFGTATASYTMRLRVTDLTTNRSVERITTLSTSNR